MTHILGASSPSNERRRPDRRRPGATIEAEDRGLPLLWGADGDDRRALPELPQGGLVGSHGERAEASAAGRVQTKHRLRRRRSAPRLDRDARDRLVRSGAAAPDRAGDDRGAQLAAAGTGSLGAVRGVPGKAGNNSRGVATMNVRRMNANQIVRLVRGAELMAQVTGESVADIVAHALGLEADNGAETADEETQAAILAGD